jgi:hypothetical protein
MADITVVAADVRPLTGAMKRAAVAGEALTVGHVVYVDSYSGNLPSVKKTAGGAVATANPFGVVVAGSPVTGGSTSIASGEGCDVVVLGPVAGFSGMTSGGNIWVSNTAGAAADAVGTKSGVLGLAESPTVLFVRPGLFVVSA